MTGTALLYLGTVLIWGTTWFAIHYQVDGPVPELWSCAYRFGLAVVMLGIVARVMKVDLKISREGHLRCLQLGLLLFGANYFLVYAATNYIPTGLVAVSFGAITIFNILFGALFLGAPIRMASVWAAALGLTGMVFVFMPEIEKVSLSDRTFFGMLLSLGATFIASLGNTTSATRTLRALPVIATNFWGMFYGTVALALAALVKDGLPVFDMRPSYLISLVYLAAFGSVAAFTMYLTLIRRIGLDKAAYTSVLYPVVALVVSTALEGFRPGPLTALGLGLVIAGNVVVLRKGKA